MDSRLDKFNESLHSAVEGKSFTWCTGNIT